MAKILEKSGNVYPINRLVSFSFVRILFLYPLLFLSYFYCLPYKCFIWKCFWFYLRLYVTLWSWSLLLFAACRWDDGHQRVLWRRLGSSVLFFSEPYRCAEGKKPSILIPQLPRALVWFWSYRSNRTYRSSKSSSGCTFLKFIICTNNHRRYVEYELEENIKLILDLCRHLWASEVNGKLTPGPEYCFVIGCSFYQSRYRHSTLQARVDPGGGASQASCVEIVHISKLHNC